MFFPGTVCFVFIAAAAFAAMSFCLFVSLVFSLSVIALCVCAISAVLASWIGASLAAFGVSKAVGQAASGIGNVISFLTGVSPITARARRAVGVGGLSPSVGGVMIATGFRGRRPIAVAMRLR